KIVLNYFVYLTMKKYICAWSLLATLAMFASCASNPYAGSNKIYKKKIKGISKSIRVNPVNPGGDPFVGTTNFGMRKPNFVIIHHTAQNSTEQTLRTFTLERTQVSSHYVIGRDGKTFQMLNDYLRAWHGGAAKWGNVTD